MPSRQRIISFFIYGAGLIVAGAMGWMLRGGIGNAESRQAAANVAGPLSSSAAQPAASGVRAASEVSQIVFGKAEWNSLPLSQRLTNGLRIKDKDHRFAYFASLLSTFTSSEEFELAAHAIFDGDTQGQQFDPEWKFLIQEWGRKKGAEAVESSVVKLTKDPGWGIKKVLHGWAETDPKAATDWLNAHTDTPDWNGALFEILSGIGNRSLETGTSAALASLPTGKSWVADEAMKSLAETAVREGGMEQMNQWFKRLPQDETGLSARAAAFAPVYDRLKHASGDEARAFLASNSSEPWRRDDPYRDMAAQMAVKNPQQAIEWLASLTQPENSTFPGVSETVRVWRNADPASLDKWMASQPNSTFMRAVQSASNASVRR